MSECIVEEKQKIAPASSMIMTPHSSARCVLGIFVEAAESNPFNHDG